MMPVASNISAAEPSGMMLREASRSAGAKLGGSSFHAQLDAASRSDKLRDAGNQLVSTAFVLPLLTQMRDDPFKSEMFHGGRAEEIFGQQLDVILADRITQSSNFGIADALVKQFTHPSASPDAGAASGVDLHG